MSMLDEVCGHLHKYFVNETFSGTYTVSGGAAIDLPASLKNGQYIRLVGSVFNDGIHQLPTSDLTDETFTGTVYGLAIPKAFLDLVTEIEAWAAADENKPSGITTESFGGYSYSRATDTKGQPTTWQGVYRARLNQWRKMP